MRNENIRDNNDLTIKGMIQVSLLDISIHLLAYLEDEEDCPERKTFIKLILGDVERVLGFTCEKWGDHWNEDCYPSLCHNPTGVAMELVPPWTKQ